MTKTDLALADLYLEDETAWLDLMAERIRAGEHAELDYSNLAEFLTDMARRDRREVESRLVVLLTHVLKWVHQPDHRSRSWKTTIIVQQQELSGELGRGVLRNHAEAVLSKMYTRASELAAIETGLPGFELLFSKKCPFTLDEVLEFDPTEEIA